MDVSIGVVLIFKRYPFIFEFSASFNVDLSLLDGFCLLSPSVVPRDFNQVFNENQVIVMLKSAAGGRVGVRAGVNFWFPLNNLSLRRPIDTKLAVWVAYIKTQIGIAYQVSVIKVKVTVTKNRNSLFA